MNQKKEAALLGQPLFFLPPPYLQKIYLIMLIVVHHNFEIKRCLFKAENPIAIG